MSNYVATDTDLTSVANAIRTKSGGSSPLSFPSGFVSEIGNIASLPTLTNPATAGDIASGKEAVDGSGNKITGTASIPSNYFMLTGGAGGRNDPIKISFIGSVINTPTQLGSYALYWAAPGVEITVDDNLQKITNMSNVGADKGLTLVSNNNFANLVELEAQALRGSGIASVNFPEVTTLSGASGGQFASCSRLTSITLPKVTSISADPTYQSSNITSVQIGSVGYTVTQLAGFATVKSTGTMTLYTNGTYVDSLLSSLRTGGVVCTIVFKASESTTYGGNSFAAGDTILTSTP